MPGGTDGVGRSSLDSIRSIASSDDFDETNARLLSQSGTLRSAALSLKQDFAGLVPAAEGPMELRIEVANDSVSLRLIRAQFDIRLRSAKLER